MFSALVSWSLFLPFPFDFAPPNLSKIHEKWTPKGHRYNDGFGDRFGIHFSLIFGPRLPSFLDAFCCFLLCPSSCVTAFCKEAEGHNLLQNTYRTPHFVFLCLSYFWQFSTFFLWDEGHSGLQICSSMYMSILDRFWMVLGTKILPKSNKNRQKMEHKMT